MKSIIPAFFACLLFAQNITASEWQSTLWLGRGDVWRARFPVTIANPSDSTLEGSPVILTVGNASGQAPLAGVRAETLRVTDEKGTQLLYGLWAPDQDSLFTTGSIPVGTTLVLPAVCAPKSSVTYHVYFDNPSAWGLADFFTKRASTDINGSFEKGSVNLPFGWQTTQAGAGHRLSWSTEKPFSGTRCLKAETNPDAEKSWFGFTRSDFAIMPGAQCTIRVRVRGENVKGSAGWYVHVGDEKNSQMINQTSKAAEGTFDWKELTITFTVPKGATRMQTGSVLYGTGTAWYDDFSFETDKEPPRASATAGAVERLILREDGKSATWPANMIKGQGFLSRLFGKRESKSEREYRLPVRVTNLRNEPAGDILAAIDLNGAARGIVSPRYLLTFNGQPVETCRLGDRLLFSCSPAASTILTYYLYVADTGARNTPSKPASSVLGSDIPSDQILADNSGTADAKAFARLLNSPVNLVKNPDFEIGENTPDAWTCSKPDSSATFAIGTPGGFGKKHIRLTVPSTARESWRGWYQSIPVKPGHSYLFGAWLSCEKLSGSANLHAHMRDAKGEVVPGGFLSAGPAIGGDSPWTPMFNTVTTPSGTSQFQLHLTMNDHGTLKHDGAFLAECLEASAGDPETPAMPAKDLVIWSVDPVIKVFHETLPAQDPAPFTIALARNEEEALQFALRSGNDIPNLKVEVDTATNNDGVALTDFTIGWVGYVPIDHRTSYYNLKTPTWELKYPTGSGSSDGWSGWWPDPIRPTATGSLIANRTQAIWLSFKTGANTPAGIYRGKIRLTSEHRTLKTVSFTVKVWNFVLPKVPSCAAIYDLRIGERWLADGKPREEQHDRLMRFMAAKKVCPDKIKVDLNFKRDTQGKITCDFSDYDKAASLYFDELKFPVSYMPHNFYLFGWEHPPKDILKEKPYEGEYPYKEIDRSKLRREYKDAYQACLRLYWEHVKAKGWADRLVLYISDEPFLTKKHIIDQMKALCDMIHEVDPKIRIYCSTWRHCPDWNGYLDIWGVGHYGCFPVTEMEARRKAAEHIWFTTDGQMCTDTPLCAVERLLPHYCFKYGADAYEFWGVSWLTYDPWNFGWHSYIHQSSTPGEYYYVRYPNGDGYLIYPGHPAGFDGPVTTVRLEAARDGVEDFDYLLLLKSISEKTGDKEAILLLSEFSSLLEIPNAGGRYSSKILPDPMRLAALRLQAGETLNRLHHK